MNTLVNNYDENVRTKTIEQVVEFFFNDGETENTDYVLGNLTMKLDAEFAAYVKFHGISMPRTTEALDDLEAEFLADTYPKMTDIEKAFDLKWPHKIDEGELA
jgi:hypothetical protein